MDGTAKQIKATESQAIARAYRQGQKQEVTIVRLLMKDSVEHENYLRVYGNEGDMEEEEDTSVTVKQKKFLSNNYLTNLLNEEVKQRTPEEG
jgi:hypothetical protein